jgi:ABC-type cobalamin/Fe3+-siderophores transport system ATPase subunit
MRVSLEGVTVRIDGITIVDGVQLVAESGQMVGLVGPNGSGKSTMLRTIYRALRPAAGAIHLDDHDVWRLSARQSAQRSAVVAQEAPSEFDLTVSEVVTMGRTPYKRLLERDSTEDARIVADALARVEMTEFAERAYATLSGGEKQRTLVARALAQRSQVLILDEATNHLDIHAQLGLMELVRGLGVTVIAALHDLNLAASYCDTVCVLSGGRVVAAGSVDDVLTPSRLAEVFGVRAHCGTHPLTGRPLLTFSPLENNDRVHDRGTSKEVSA